tara:strand:- start:137 stop:478 length:342 start_codon:yes stop_codon:yes gene_type:complete
LINFKIIIVLYFVFHLFGCLGPFKKKLEPLHHDRKLIIVAPGISNDWEKIKPISSSKDQIIELIGDPDFIDTHNAGEDWYYANRRSVGYALISFPISGHLDNHVQYIKYPEWK